MQIIIIDDEQTNCKLLEIFVKRWGYNSISFVDSVKGYKYLKDLNEPAIICIDWMMPDMSGIEVLGKIRDERPEFPFYFIVLTAKTGLDNIVEALDAGADDFLTKPFDAKELRSRIGAGERVIQLEHKIIEKDKKLQKINDKLKVSLEIIEDDVKAGRAIQFKLLPSNYKEINGIKFSHHLEPSLYLSGDFLDYYSITDKFVGFYFIDVAGHGASSAFVTIFVKSFISEYISKFKKNNDESIFNPALVVKELNERLLEAKVGKHLTIFIGIIDLDQSRMTFCNGGQFPFPIILIKNHAEYLDKKGFPVGLIPKAKYHNEKIELPDKFKLFLFSDGLLDIIPEEGIKAQQDYILKNVGDCSTTFEMLMNKINSIKTAELPDDITTMLIEKGE